ncbi:hypothetical protein EDD18DRAFT_1439502 [Armillaria luteobubalina]|uniref:Uncharacterized protein n=1 Tax=Armillaria luteobubalina TaxID=153913 RepID=A0AA39PA92_9AGAR|nr:hypothetical protein EDD18DRAFT_1439502 [Armillaria luteobubalina]
MSAPNLYSIIADIAVSALIEPPEAWTSPATSPITYANWAHLPEWIKEALGDDWHIWSGHVSVMEAASHACWWLGPGPVGSSTSPAINVNVYVQSHTDANGALDMAASRQATRHRLERIINSHSRVITEVWTRGKLDEYGECSVQYIEGDRFVVVAGQTIVDIRDARTFDLAVEIFEDYAYKLLNHTVRRKSPPLTAPVIKRGPLLSLTSGKQDLSRPRKIQIRSVVNARFSFWFELETPIAVADARVEASADAIELERCVVEEGVRVKFTFGLARQGHHVVEVCTEFADSETLVSTSQTVEVEVFYKRD